MPPQERSDFPHGRDRLISSASSSMMAQPTKRRRRRRAQILVWQCSIFALLLSDSTLAKTWTTRSAFAPPLPSSRSSTNPTRTRQYIVLSLNGDDSSLSHNREDDCDAIENTIESLSGSIHPSPPPIIKRRQFFQQQILASTLFSPTVSQATSYPTLTIDNGYFSLRNNNNAPYDQRELAIREQKQKLKERAEQRRRVTSPSKLKKWTPFVNVKKWDSVETCLLEMLPVRNPVFRQLQALIEDLADNAANDYEGWRQTLLDAVTILSLLNSKRNFLQPVFNQEDSTEMYISKSSLGERNIESLRSKLEDLITIASGGIDLDMFDINESGRKTVNAGLGTTADGRRRGRKRKQNTNSDIEYIDVGGMGDIDVDAFIEAKRQVLLVLAELGELLVPSYPYAVPTSGKFGYLPRLLGRCTVTLSFERPSAPSTAFGFNLGGIGGKGKFLGNVTIIADGYAAPISAGNFVDLSARNFYTGLSVKAMRKRLGVVPTWNDNVLVNDLTELRDTLDELKGSALELPETLKKAKQASDRGISRSDESDNPFAEPMYDESRLTMDVAIPVLGSFEEGFYDPLTAKPRRIPLEVVALDSNSPTKSTLTYSSSYASLDEDMIDAGRATKLSGTTKYSALMSSSSAQRSFSSATSSASSNSTAAMYSNLDPVLSFNIPGLVALNHPDRASDGGSSEFFALPRRDISGKRSKLLDGQYAPFGYIVSGSDVYNSLRPGDVIGSTYVSDVGLLNLVKIRKNAFESGEDDDVVVEEDNSDEEKSDE